MRNRVTNPDRKERRKISTELDLERFVSETVGKPLPRENCLELSNDTVFPMETAEKTRAHFDL